MYVYVCISVFGFCFCDRSKVYFDGVVIEGVAILEEFLMNEKKELQPTKNYNLQRIKTHPFIYYFSY